MTTFTEEQLEREAAALCKLKGWVRGWHQTHAARALIRTAREAIAMASVQEQGQAMHTLFSVGSRVEKVGGDYTFVGTVVAAFEKLSGAARFVVEYDRGVLHVYSAKNLRELF